MQLIEFLIIVIVLTDLMIGPYCYSMKLFIFVIVIYHLIIARGHQKN